MSDWLVEYPSASGDELLAARYRSETTGDVWNGAEMVPWDDGDVADYDVDATYLGGDVYGHEIPAGLPSGDTYVARTTHRDALDDLIGDVHRFSVGTVPERTQWTTQYPGSANLYALYRSQSTGKVWNGAAMVDWDDADIATYDVPATYAGGDLYVHTIPDDLPAGDTYIGRARVRAGGAPATNDSQVGDAFGFDWDGSEATDPGLTTVVVFTPIQSALSRNPFRSRNLPETPAGTEPPDLWTITDAADDPINLTGKTIRFVVASIEDPTPDSDGVDAVLTGLYQYETGGSGITIGGTHHNEVTVQHDAENTAEAGAFRYFLVNVTDNIVLAKGRMTVTPSVLVVA